VLRELLNLGPSNSGKVPVVRDGKPWVTKGVTFPHGTKFRTTYKDQRYFALVENGALVVASIFARKCTTRMETA
jgi:hypothetical protein